MEELQREVIMSVKVNGELVPIGGGDPIPLIREQLTIGRRESCDICLRFPNVSGRHCELTFRQGFWVIRDLGSTNGIKVNDQRVQQKTLRPGDEINIAKRRFTIQYTPGDGPMPEDEAPEPDFMEMSLLERAGLVQPEHPKRPAPRPRPDPYGMMRQSDPDDR
jgi:adenylate cyclase